MPSAKAIAAVANDQRWRKQAVCHPANGHDPEIWFPPTPRPYATRAEARAATAIRLQWEAQAKTLCAACPVRLECLQYANDNDEREGIWGGLTVTERGLTPLR
ncbi:WhiB family transcription factor [Mycobacterium phage Gancho]|uniref:WhiB family transcription factor n=1 Tax=Mycobacterium phage Gancho TaxID=2301613 RepID=A0A385UES9_9CAUD|nr:WhiB family transcription factor [Mycobacterium phage Gancho]